MKNKLTRILAIIFTLCPFAIAAQDAIRSSQVAAAEKMYDLDFTVVKRDSMMSSINTELAYYQYLHKNNLPNDVPMSIWFDPALPGMKFNMVQQPIH